MLADVAIELEWRNKRYSSVQKGLEAVGADIEADMEKIGPIVRSVLERYMRGVVKSVQDRTSRAYPSGTSRAGAFPGTLSRRSGTLYASLSPERIKVTGKGADDIAVSFTLTGIAVVHENGATITPKRAKYLTIPLPAALNANGTPKLPNARAWKDTFIIKSKKGNLLIVQKSGRNGITPLYVLKKSVTIPKRLAFKEAFEAGRDLVADEIAKQVIREFFNA